jgi:hypothetical protein
LGDESALFDGAVFDGAVFDTAEFDTAVLDAAVLDAAASTGRGLAWTASGEVAMRGSVGSSACVVAGELLVVALVRTVGENFSDASLAKAPEDAFGRAFEGSPGDSVERVLPEAG